MKRFLTVLGLIIIGLGLWVAPSCSPTIRSRAKPSDVVLRARDGLPQVDADARRTDLELGYGVGSGRPQ